MSGSGQNRLIALGVPFLIGVFFAFLAQPEPPSRVGFLAAPLQSLDSQVLDYQFALRHFFGRDPSVDDRIVIVGVDEATDEVLGKPGGLWGEEYAAVFAALDEAGARSIGFDVILNPNIGGLDEDDEVYVRVEREMRSLADTVSGLRSFVMIGQYEPDYEDRITDPGFLENYDESERWEKQQYWALLGYSISHPSVVRVGAANVGRDADLVVRRVSFWFQADKTVTEVGERPGHQVAERSEAFFGVLAEEATQQRLSRQGQIVVLGQQQVVTEPGPYLRVNYPYPTPRTEGRLALSKRETDYQSAFPILLFSDILQGQRADVNGKICIVAPEAPSYQDLRSTPFTRWTSFNSLGAEIHAAALNTLLTGQYLRPPPVWVAAAIPIALALVVGGISGFAPDPRKAILMSSGAVGAYLAGTVVSFSLAGIFLPVVAPVLSALASLLFGQAYRSRTVEKQKAFVEGVFGRMVSEEVTKTLLLHPEHLKLGGSRREVTVLFTDINNFTPRSEKRTPEQVITMLNDFFEEMVRIILSHNGYLKQFVGDEIMVIFGTPNPQKDQAARAVRTALDMMARLHELREQDPDGDEGGFYDVKVGVHSGSAVVGLVGSQERSEYAAVGDDVNLGARIMGLTKKLGCNVLVSEATMRRAAPYLPGVEWTCRGSQSFKGKTREMVLYEARDKEIGGGEVDNDA